MSIDAHDCSPSTVAQEVSESVVIMLDNKCYPLLDNAATSIISFWKSTMILAASKSIFQKLSGSSLELKRANDKVDLTQRRMKSCHHQPSKHPRTTSGLDEVFEKVHKIESRFTFISLRYLNVFVKR